MPQVAAAVAALDPATSPTRCATGGTVGIAVDGREHQLAADDARSSCMQPLEGYQLEREGSHAVALDLALDDELRREGLAREIVHAVQGARKDAGLDVEDRIALTLGGDERAARGRARARGLRHRRDAGDVDLLRRPSTATGPAATIEGRSCASPSSATS